MENEERQDVIPQVGDVWVTERLDGTELRGVVTQVILPEEPGNDIRISIDDRGLSHIGWWYGQGWSELEEGCKNE